MKRKINIILFSLMITAALSACGTKDAENTESVVTAVKTETTDVADVMAVDDSNAVENATEETKEAEGNESISEEESVPWDNMSPVNLRDFPAGIKGLVNENDVFFPDILFPSEYIAADGICRASLNGKDYNAYAYVETHSRTIADGGGLYFEQVGDFIIYTDDIVKNIEIKDTAHDYLMHISIEIWGANSDFKDEYLLRNCEYIKEQLSEWDQKLIPDTEENIIDNADVNSGSDNASLLECDIIPCGFYDLDGNKYVMVSTYDDDDSGECMLTFGRYDGADSPFDYYDLKNVADNTYSATNWDKVSVTVTFSDGGMDLSGGTGELEEYNGHYTLQYGL